jgi:hypothetical protein
LGPQRQQRAQKERALRLPRPPSRRRSPRSPRAKLVLRRTTPGRALTVSKRSGMKTATGKETRCAIASSPSFPPLLRRPFVQTRGTHAVHTPQENGIKDIDEAYLTLWERLRLDMIRSKSEGAAFLPVCSSETRKALSRALFSFGRPRVCALRVVPDRPTKRRQGLPHGEPLPERVFPGRRHHRRAGAYLRFPFAKPYPQQQRGRGLAESNLALLRYCHYSRAFRIRTTARRRTSSRRSTRCVSRRILSNSWTRCPACTTTVRTDLSARS